MDHDTDDSSTAVPTDNDETSVVPSTAATEISDVEHTLAADIADSKAQGLYAWSENSDDETELIQRRSWKLPIALAAMAIAAASTVGVVKAWPHHSTPESPAAKTATHTAMPTVVDRKSVV